LYARYEQLDLELTAKLVAYNLDWYLWPRELIIRGEWVVGLSYMLVVTGYLFFPYSSAGVPPGTTSLSYIHPILLVASFVTVYSFIMHLSRQRLIIHCDALIAHFLARHAATPDEQNGE
jgi:hypothetical protein